MIVLSACDQRILSVLRIKRIHCIDNLGEIIFRLGLLGLVLHGPEGGKSRPIKIAMMAITTRSSMSVNASRWSLRVRRWLTLSRFKNLTLVAGRFKTVKPVKKVKNAPSFFNFVTF
jgi:hypothetical protein